MGERDGEKSRADGANTRADIEKARADGAELASSDLQSRLDVVTRERDDYKRRFETFYGPPVASSALMQVTAKNGTKEYYYQLGVHNAQLCNGNAALNYLWQARKLIDSEWFPTDNRVLFKGQVALEQSKVCAAMFMVQDALRFATEAHELIQERTAYVDGRINLQRDLYFARSRAYLVNGRFTEAVRCAKKVFELGRGADIDEYVRELKRVNDAS